MTDFVPISTLASILHRPNNSVDNCGKGPSINFLRSETTNFNPHPRKLAYFFSPLLAYVLDRHTDPSYPVKQTIKSHTHSKKKTKNVHRKLLSKRATISTPTIRVCVALKF